LGTPWAHPELIARKCMLAQKYVVLSEARELGKEDWTRQKQA
jgi:hypothetical protein